MRVRYTPRAQSDLDAIFTYLDARAPTAAQAVKNLIVRRIASLGDFPFIAPASDMPEVFELTIVRYPYKVYYEIGDNEVWIIHIRDARRQFWQDNES